MQDVQQKHAENSEPPKQEIKMTINDGTHRHSLFNIYELLELRWFKNLHEQNIAKAIFIETSHNPVDEFLLKVLVSKQCFIKTMFASIKVDGKICVLNRVGIIF